ncbi:MAG TPA: nucleotidyltransferase domain-containing protein [Azospirillum sp.]|nr:nucleotidyltransferase domain-containing protein [Azospirillum sp.]
MAIGIAPFPSRQPRDNYGAFGSEAATLTALCKRLAAGLDPREIWLFGSRARGDALPDSDFDLLLVFDDEAGSDVLDYDRAYAPLLGLGIGCDVVPCLKSDFDAERAIPGTIPHAASRGRLIHRRDG